MQKSNQHIPLAERMRPQTLSDFVGQHHLTAKGQVLEQMISNNKLHSIIFWGPPGVGKTTLANIIAQSSGLTFFKLSAIDSGVKDVRLVIDMARKAGHAILFIDEIHRFNKAQQDSLLGAVEKGVITLIGATTENPSFEVISALLSRCQVYILHPLDAEDLKRMVADALARDEQLQNIKIKVLEWEALLQYSGGDGRKLLNLLELVVSGNQGEVAITNQLVQDVVQQKMALYDKAGEQHYDIISAFIKSIRGSDPNATVYWLARMLAGGEDPKFIARRLVILAAEDIGNANPNALLMATNTFTAITQIGMPEGRIILSQCAIYLATSPKGNATYLAINEAMDLVKKTGDLSVPLHLRNAPTQLMKQLNYGENYQYAHNYDNNFVMQEFLPESIAGTAFYMPGDSLAEQRVSDFLKLRWKEKYGYGEKK